MHHPFDGFRVYDGCPDTTMQRRLDAEASLFTEVKRRHPEAHATYFPVEGTWQVHIWGVPLSGSHRSKSDALREALTQAPSGR